MAEYLTVMAEHVRNIEKRPGSEANAGATLLQALAHLQEPAWKRWVEREVKIDVGRARELMAMAERQGASLDSLRPREI